MAKVKENNNAFVGKTNVWSVNSLVAKKSAWSAISIWWGILVFLIAIPVFVGIIFAVVDYNAYVTQLVKYATERLHLNTAVNGEASSKVILELYDQKLAAGEIPVTFIQAIQTRQWPAANGWGQFALGLFVMLGDMSYKSVTLVRNIAIVVALAIFTIALISLIVRIVCAKKTSWTFYDGAIIYKKGRILFTEECTRDMEFFPGMEISVRCTLKGKLFRYGKVILSNGAGEAGEIVLSGVKYPHKIQAALREMLAICCTRTANMMSPYKMYPQMYRHVLGGYPAYYYGTMQMNNTNNPNPGK